MSEFTREGPEAGGPERAALRGSPQPVPWVAQLTPAVHGAFDASMAKRGQRDIDVLDFSANGNVLGPSVHVQAALNEVDLARYPDRTALPFRTVVAAYHDVPLEAVLAGNGSTELIWAIARAYLRPGDTAVTLGPAYGEYRVASAATGAEAHELLHPRLAATEEWVHLTLRSYQPRVVWICHPNNPTGDAFPLEWLPNLLAAYPSTLFVVDEAYLPVAEGLPSALPLVGTGQVVVLRSMTKDAGLAGLRVGYGIAAPPVAAVIQRVIPPWSVNALAQAAGVAALEDRSHAEQARIAVGASRRHLVAGLGRLDIFPRPSVANFVLARIGDGARATELLLQRGIAVRDCASFGLPEYIRIGVRSIPDQERLLAALAEVDLG